MRAGSILTEQYLPTAANLPLMTNTENAQQAAKAFDRVAWKLSRTIFTLALVPNPYSAAFLSLTMPKEFVRYRS
jgi:hypothetical protein